ncbi:D-alanyl-D-alanine carboxypeptidase family protein [Aureimonas mangrovi]|uniref:D-alanyl-D-alanine carboxypeptidase family protein n=1 Tax=Aureimonas mangrovi TaxID=2758041 RepID=UPI003CCE4C83
MAALALLTGIAVAQPAEEDDGFATSAHQALILDADTGAILYEHNADERFLPASLAKLMTAEMVMEALAEGRATLETAYRVSDFAWRTGGAPSRTATMFAAVRSDIPVEALLQGLMVQQANDAALILAEGLEGSEDAFVHAMNRRAQELGLTGSTFVNATGLPQDGQSVTARDMALLARHIQTSHPDQYALYAQPDFEWNGIRQRNRNPLLGLEIGATGLATGFAEGQGYAIVASATREGRTNIAALAGLETERERTSETRRLLDWAQESFEARTLFTAGQRVGSALVFGGASGEVAIGVDKDVAAYIPKDRPESVEAALVYEGPLRAPITAGDKVGRIEIRVDGRTSVVHELHAQEDVVPGTFTERALGAAQELAFGWIRAL